MKNSFNDLTRDELIQKRDELKSKVKDLRFQRVMGHVENPMDARNIRRSIARISTILREKDMGIRKA
jgi:large subunit ribosomal protein L29